MQARDLRQHELEALTDGGRKVWRSRLAARVDRNLLYHYIMACNSFAEYIEVKRELEAEEKAGKSSYMITNVNGVRGIHPLRLQLDKSRRAFGTEMKLCRLDAASMEETDSKEQGDDFLSVADDE